MTGKFSEDVFSYLRAWRADGHRTALLTLYNVEPTGPRPAGSQMAVSEAGNFVGFLSGGCVEGALVEEARAAMDERKNRSIRYGVNSPYFDIELPCGSAIDVYIDVGLSDEAVNSVVDAQTNRSLLRLVTNMHDGTSHLAQAEDTDRLQLVLIDKSFDRLYRPPLRLVVAGKGPVLAASAEIAIASGMIVHAVTTEDEIAAQCEAAGATTSKTMQSVNMDTWTAAATLFHEHELEDAVLGPAMDSDAFYIGALGSRKTHAERVGRLIGAGRPDADIDRIRGPLGINIGSRNPPEIAISMVAEILQSYRERFPV